MSVSIVPPSTAPAPGATAIRVVCVDDNADVLAALQLVIDSDPSMACIACLPSADDLMQKVGGYTPMPDVIILDATMPGLDPLTAVKDLATRYPKTRTIMYTGYDDARFIDKIMAAGAWGYVRKHEEPGALLRAVREVAAGRAVLTRG